jgi:hypothetical protein
VPVGLAGVRAVPRVPVELRKVVYTTNAIESRKRVRPQFGAGSASEVEVAAYGG